MNDQLMVRYCSNPDGHAPKDCPDFPKGDQAILYKWDRADLKANLRSMDIELDDELDETELL